MSIRSAIYTLLSGLEADSYPLFAPQETTDPYVAYSTRLAPIRTQEGVHLTEVDLTLDIYASDFDSAVALASTMYAGLEGAEGAYDDQSLMVCNWISESDSYISDLDKVNITQEYNLKFN